MSPRPPSVNAAMLGRIEASIMAESAVVDKESGRVYWEGGDSSTLSASLYPKIGIAGFSHMKATMLTAILLLALVSFLAQWIRKRMATWEQPSSTSGETIKGRLFKSIGLFLLQWTLLKTPNFDRSFVICVFLFYLFEAYNCSTRRYLTNAISSPKEVEEYIEQLRNQAPVVTWKVRCFHYEKPYWLSPLKATQALWNLFFKSKDKKPENLEDENVAPVVQKDDDTVSGPFRRKVVSHQATANYTFERFDDATIAGVWRRQTAISNEAAPFMKIVLSKILVLANSDAKKDYFKQQSNFVTSEGMRDRFAEYSTNIEVPGFKRRMLAVRPVEGVPSAKLFRLTTFWIFTFMGLSLPYRIWFASHADKLRVTVVKETHALSPRSSSFSGWFTSSSKPAQSMAFPATNKGGTFREQMQAMSLYAQQEEGQQSDPDAMAMQGEKAVGVPNAAVEGPADNANKLDDSDVLTMVGAEQSSNASTASQGHTNSSKQVEPSAQNPGEGAVAIPSKRAAAKGQDAPEAPAEKVAD